MMKWTLVYFDDQIQNIEAFKDLLEENFHVVGCNDATKFSQVLHENHPHAFLLDVHMPFMDGHQLYENIINHPLYNGCPVFFISGDQSEENKLRSYKSGGLDFLDRTLGFDELIIRLSNKIKFYLQMSTKLELGNLSINVEALKITINGEQADITLLEMRILSNLLRAYPMALTRNDLILKIWGNEVIKPGTINTHITNLRPKIEPWDHILKIRDENLLIQKKT